MSQFRGSEHYEGGTFLQNVGRQLSNLRGNNAGDLMHPCENKYTSGLCSGNIAATQAMIFTRAVYLGSHSIDKKVSCSYRRFIYVSGKLSSAIQLEFSVSPSHMHTHKACALSGKVSKEYSAVLAVSRMSYVKQSNNFQKKKL